MLIFLITKDQGDHRDYNKMEILVVRAYNSRDEKKSNSEEAQTQSWKI